MKKSRFRNHMKFRKKLHVTLIEMMIVMFLIALISGVVAYNYRGTLDEGKAFKTRSDMKTIENVLNLHIGEHQDDLEGIESDWKKIVKASPIVQNPNSLMKDGWGGEYHVQKNNDDIEVRSAKLEEYDRKNKQKLR